MEGFYFDLFGSNDRKIENILERVQSGSAKISKHY